jgi:hypothetical protein
MRKLDWVCLVACWLSAGFYLTLGNYAAAGWAFNAGLLTINLMVARG